MKLAILGSIIGMGTGTLLVLKNHENRIRALEQRQEQATPEPRVLLRPAFRIEGSGTQPAPSGLKLAAN